jgi:hypothetical protein
MLKGIETKSESVKIACLSICTRLFKVFGQLILRSATNLVNKDQCMKAIVEQMTKGSSINLRKKASQCMGAYSQVLNSNQLSNLCTQLITTITASKSKAEIIIQMQCFSEMSKFIRQKLAPYLQKILPLVQGLMMKIDPKTSADEQNDLTGACLETLQQIVKSCPREVATYIPELFKNSLTLLEYDPNFVYDNNVKMADDEEDGGWGSDFENDV